MLTILQLQLLCIYHSFSYLQSQTYLSILDCCKDDQQFILSIINSVIHKIFKIDSFLSDCSQFMSMEMIDVLSQLSYFE